MDGNVLFSVKVAHCNIEGETRVVDRSVIFDPIVNAATDGFAVGVTGAFCPIANSFAVHDFYLVTLRIPENPADTFDARAIAAATPYFHRLGIEL